MSSTSAAAKNKLETANRKQKYKELIEKGSIVSKYLNYFVIISVCYCFYAGTIALVLTSETDLLSSAFSFAGENIENQDVLETFHKILDIVQLCENVSANFVKDGRIENASDYLMDAQILKMSHDLMGSTADKMGNTDFSEDEFITALNDLFTIENGDHDFDKLADIAVKCCRTSQFSVSLLGAVDFEAGPRPEKVRKESQRQKKNVGPTKAPTNVKQLTKSHKGAEKINVVRSEIQRVCRERQTDCLPYYELICDPQSFMKSVDAAFQIAFLVRDGLLGLKKINDEPHAYLYDPDPMTQQSQRQSASDTVQCVMSFTPMLWKEKIIKFHIGEPLLILDDGEEIPAQMEVDSA